MAVLTIFSRQSQETTPTGASSKPSSISTPIYLVGIIIAVIVVLVLAIWLGLRTYRKRLANKREEIRGAAFLSVKGIVRDNVILDEKDLSGQPSADVFSRNKIDETVVLPRRARVAQPHSATAIVEAQRQSGAFPAAFAPAPFARTSMFDPNGPPTRRSFMSTYSENRYSVMSNSSSFNSSVTGGTARKVRQLFDPVLPDELVTRLGEQLTVVQSFDDGWCVVGREASGLRMPISKSLFKPTPDAENDVELGVVPAWCFLKPVKGLRAERPVRSTSLGITVNVDTPGHSNRGELISWSNF